MNVHQSDTAQIAAALQAASQTGGLLGDATAYHLASGGKAWRAHLAIGCGRALGLDGQHVIGLAAACELVHQASVVHDDVQDRALLRRGRPSVAARFGEQAAVCVGDHLLVGAFATVASLPVGQALVRMFAAGVSEMAAAQAEEFSTALWSTMTWTRYEALIAGKAGAMVVLPLAGAALLAELSPSDVLQVSRAARVLGAAYQASDDIADLAADVASGSLNGVIARRLELAGETARAALLDVLARARRDRLPPAEAALQAGGLQQDRAAVSDWARSLRPRAAAMLRGRSGLRCHALVPVIDRAADALLGGDTIGWESRHAA
jgi:geranylgeranyl diphosphate synthase type II